MVAKVKESEQLGGAGRHLARAALQQKKRRSQRGMLFATTVAFTVTEAMRKPKSRTTGSVSGGKTASAGPRTVDAVAARDVETVKLSDGG